LPGLIGADAAGQDSFAARLLWRPGGGGAASLRTLSAGESRQPTLGMEAFEFPRGQWFKIEQEVVLNTPKQANGKLVVWIDGRMVGERSDLVFRTHASVAVTGVAADVFYGGDDAATIVPKDATVRLSPFESCAGRSISPGLGRQGTAARPLLDTFADHLGNAKRPECAQPAPSAIAVTSRQSLASTRTPSVSAC
jgi:hypothetical protein